MDYGICRIYSPDDGRELGLQGMINDLVMKSDFPTGDKLEKNMIDAFEEKDNHHIAQTISAFENNIDQYQEFYQEVKERAEKSQIPILEMKETGDAGKCRSDTR